MFTLISTWGKMESTNVVHCLIPYEIIKFSLRQNPKKHHHFKTNIIFTHSKCTDIEHNNANPHPTTPVLTPRNNAHSTHTRKYKPLIMLKDQT